MTPRALVEQAFADNRDRVEAVAARIVRDPTEAADVASEVFLNLLERGPAEIGSITAWLVASARNRAINRVRDRERERRNITRLDPPVHDDAPASDIGVDDLLGRTMAALGERDRRAVQMRYGADLSYEQVAEALSVTPRQARVVVHRAVQRMRKAAVEVLADHHGAPAACKQTLVAAAGRRLAAAHEGCTPCRTVIDEVVALGAPALVALPGARLFTRMHTGIADVASRMRAPGIERLGEALAALALAGTLALPQTATPATPAATLDNGIGSNATTTSVALAAGSGAARADGSVGGVRDVVSYDDGDDVEPPVPHSVSVLGRTLKVPDLLTGPDDASADIRRFEFGTLASSGGAPDGLFARITLGAEFSSATNVTVDWWFDDGLCVARMDVLWKDTTPDGLISGSCMKDATNPRATGVVSTGEDLGTGSIDVSFAGEQVVLKARFEAMPERMRTLLRPGDLLTQVRAISSSNALVSTTDTAPDEAEEVEYRISR